MSIIFLMMFAKSDAKLVRLSFRAPAYKRTASFWADVHCEAHDVCEIRREISLAWDNCNIYEY